MKRFFKYTIFVFVALFSLLVSNSFVFAKEIEVTDYLEMIEVIKNSAKNKENWSFSKDGNNLIVTLFLGKHSDIYDEFHSGFYLDLSQVQITFYDSNGNISLFDATSNSSGSMQYGSEWNEDEKKDYSSEEDILLTWEIPVYQKYDSLSADAGAKRLADFDPTKIKYITTMSSKSGWNKFETTKETFTLDYNIFKDYVYGTDDFDIDDMVEGSSEISPKILHFSTLNIAKYTDYDEGANRICTRKADEEGKTGNEKEEYINSCISTVSSCLEICSTTSSDETCRSKKCGEKFGDMKYGTSTQTQSFTCSSDNVSENGSFYFTFDIEDSEYGRFTVKKNNNYVSTLPDIYFLDNGKATRVQADNESTNSSKIENLFSFSNKGKYGKNIYYVPNCSGTYTFELIDANKTVIYTSIVGEQGKEDAADQIGEDNIFNPVDKKEDEPDISYDSYEPICGIFKPEESGGKLLPIVKNLYRILKIAIPVLVVILTIVEFLKVLFSGEDKTMKDAFKATTTRLILIAVLIFLPIIIEFVIKITGLSENCLQQFIG